MQWRKWNIIIHRDVGYLCAGLTIVYAVSGVAVNHVRDWNPNYKISRVESNIGPVLSDDPRSPEVVRDILHRVGEGGDYRDSFRPDSATLEIFLDGGTVTVDLTTGHLVLETVRNRTLLREANFLHLNHARRLWTYMADLYAVALAVVAITGLFVLKGKKGITGRGAWLTGVGVVIPIAFLLAYL
jgi:hypothetical protein